MNGFKDVIIVKHSELNRQLGNKLAVLNVQITNVANINSNKSTKGDHCIKTNYCLYTAKKVKNHTFLEHFEIQKTFGKYARRNYEVDFQTQTRDFYK